MVTSENGNIICPLLVHEYEATNETIKQAFFEYIKIVAPDKPSAKSFVAGYIVGFKAGVEEEKERGNRKRNYGRF